MSEHRTLILAAIVVALCASAAPALAETGPFRDLSLDSLSSLPDRGGSWEIPLPRHFRALEVDADALETLLAQAPPEGRARLRRRSCSPSLIRTARTGSSGSRSRRSSSRVWRPNSPRSAPSPPGDRRSHGHRAPEPHLAGLPCHGAVGVGHRLHRSLPPVGCAVCPLLLQGGCAQAGGARLPLRCQGREPGGGESAEEIAGPPSAGRRLGDPTPHLSPGPGRHRRVLDRGLRAQSGGRRLCA